jgi:hypothetical protein
MNKITKAVLALNVAGVARALRCGPGDAARKLISACDVIDPWGKPSEEISDETLQHSQSVPMVDLEGVVPQLPFLRMDARQDFIDGALPYRDLVALLSLLDEWKPELVLEIGTFNGSTTAAMALNAPQAVIHTVDLPLDYDPSREEAGAMPKDDHHLIKKRRVGQAYISRPEIKNIVQHFVDSSDWDFAPVKGASFFFVDGAHTYDYVRNDTEKCMAVAAPRARFLLHDCDEYHADVIRYASELVRQGKSIRRIRNTAIAFFDRNG